MCLLESSTGCGAFKAILTACHFTSEESHVKMEKMNYEVILMQRTYRAFSILFWVCFLLIAASVLLCNGLFLAVACVCLGFYWLSRHQVPRFTLWLLVGGILVRLVVIWILHPPLESDFEKLYEAAQSLLAGDLSFNSTPYFRLWAYQSAYVCWEAMWLTIWNHPIFLEIVHACFAAGTVCLLYRIVLPHVRQSSAQLMALLLTCFPFACTLTTVLTNQIPSAFFLVLGIWLLICPDAERLRFWRYPLCGVALQMGNLLRPEGIIILIAVLAWLFFSLLREPKRVKRLLCGVLALIALYYAVGFGADWLAKATGLNPNGLQNSYPGWKFVCGLNHETGGMYSEDDWNLLGSTLDENYMPTPETEQLQKELISQRLHVSPAQLGKLILNKVRNLWTAGGLVWAFRHVSQSSNFFVRELYQVIRDFDRALFFLVFALACFGLRKKKSPDGYLPYFVFFAAFCAFLPIEVQPRYAYLPQLFLFAASAFGLDELANIIENRRGELRCL